MYGEDVDWPYRLRAAGWSVVYFPQAIVVHLGAQTTRRQPLGLGVDAFRAQHRFFWKHYGRTYSAVYRALAAALSIGKLASFAPLFLIPSARRSGQATDKLQRHVTILRWAITGR